MRYAAVVVMQTHREHPADYETRPERAAMKFLSWTSLLAAIAVIILTLIIATRS